ncbi:MAG: spherulation-specific family 4 protein [Acidobacteriota bacterium]
MNKNPRTHVVTALACCLLLAALPAASVADASLRILIPAYGNPCCGTGFTMWEQLIDDVLVMGDDLQIILNPNSGPGGPLIDPNYIGPSGEGPLVDLRDNGGFVIAYVRTDFARLTLADVQTDIDHYYTPSYWRGAGIQIDGIFFDEVSNDLANVGYYETLRDYVRGYDPSARVVGNPGTAFVNNPSGQTTFTISDYADMADTLVTFEVDADLYVNGYTPPSWLDTRPAESFGNIVYDLPSASQMVSAMSLAIRRKARYVYITDDVLINPYDALPSYWAEQLEAARGLVFADGFESGGTDLWMPAEGGR